MRRNPTAMKWGEDAPGTAGVILFGLESLGLSGDGGEAARGAGLVAGGNLKPIESDIMDVGDAAISVEGAGWVGGRWRYC